MNIFLLHSSSWSV